MFSRLFRGVVIVLFLVALAPGLVVDAVEYGGLGGIPANPDPNNSRTKSIFVFTLEAGAGKQDGVNVVNNTADTKTVEVYAVDSEIASGGSFACRQKVDPKTEVGKWINLSQTEVTLAPSSNQTVNFEIVVPNPVSVGEHNGCIVIQEKADSTEATGNGVQLSFRSAIRVAVTVPGDIKKDVEFTDLRANGEANKYIIRASLSNKGNVSLDTDLKVSVKNLFNREVYQNGGVYPLLAQAQVMDLNFDWPRPFWGGIFRVAGQASYNGDPAVALGQAGDKNVTKTAPSQWLLVGPSPPALALIILILLLILILIWQIIRRNHKRKKVSKNWRSFIVSDGDTVVSLAREHRTKWKTIVKVNRLKPPYELKPGTNIKLPVNSKE